MKDDIIPKDCENCPHVLSDKNGYVHCLSSNSEKHIIEEGTYIVYFPGSNCIYGQIKELKKMLINDSSPTRT